MDNEVDLWLDQVCLINGSGSGLERRGRRSAVTPEWLYHCISVTSSELVPIGARRAQGSTLGLLLVRWKSSANYGISG